jgi:hypothetical protein
MTTGGVAVIGSGLLLIGLSANQTTIVVAEIGLALTGLGMGLATGPLMGAAVGDSPCDPLWNCRRTNQRSPNDRCHDRGCHSWYGVRLGARRPRRSAPVDAHWRSGTDHVRRGGMENDPIGDASDTLTLRCSAMRPRFSFSNHRGPVLNRHLHNLSSRRPSFLAPSRIASLSSAENPSIQPWRAELPIYNGERQARSSSFFLAARATSKSDGPSE